MPWRTNTLHFSKAWPHNVFINYTISPRHKSLIQFHNQSQQLCYLFSDGIIKFMEYTRSSILKLPLYKLSWKDFKKLKFSRIEISKFRHEQRKVIGPYWHRYHWLLWWCQQVWDATFFLTFFSFMVGWGWFFWDLGISWSGLGPVEWGLLGLWG